MKKIYLILICLTLLFGVCGCNNQSNSNNSDSKYNENNNMAKNEKLNCSILNNIKMVFIEESLYVTNDGYLYKMGNFSDGTNCKKIDDNIKFTKMIDMFLMDNQENLYSIDNDSQLKKYEYPSNYEIYINDESIVKATISYNTPNTTYFLRNDGIIYTGILKLEQKPGVADKNIITDEKIYKSFPNEKILDFSLETQDSIMWIKTDKSYYVKRIKDENCQKYDDIKCEYDFVKDEYLTKKYNDISYIYGCITSMPTCNYVQKDGKKYQDHLGG